jgi:hypothetical protein
MRILKRILLVLLGVWLTYVAYLYIVSPKVTYLVRKGYEGPLVIIANQKDGIEINRNRAVYDFTKSNLIKLKGDLLTGFFPWGYLNYYSVDGNGEQEKMESIDDAPENSTATEDKIYVWGYYYTNGGCEISKGNKIYYESLVVSKKSNTTIVVSEKNKLINQEVCDRKAAH